MFLTFSGYGDILILARGLLVTQQLYQAFLKFTTGVLRKIKVNRPGQDKGMDNRKGNEYDSRGNVQIMQTRSVLHGSIQERSLVWQPHREGRYEMQKAEFEERIEGQVSDEDYKLIEFIYQWHPVIRNVSGKDEVAELYKSFGMALFRDMEPRAKKTKEVEEQMTSCRLEIETLTELLATRKEEMKDLEAKLQELRI